MFRKESILRLLSSGTNSNLPGKLILLTITCGITATMVFGKMFLLAGIVTTAICFVPLTSGVHAKEELDEVEKELDNALEQQGKSNLNTMYKRDNGDSCEEECADVPDVPDVDILRRLGDCTACLCGKHPSWDICDGDDNDDDDDDMKGQPETKDRESRFSMASLDYYPAWVRNLIYKLSRG